MTRVQITALVLLAALVWGSWLSIAGIAVGVDHLKPFSLTVGVLVVTLLFFDRVAWKWAGIRQLIADRPLLSGSWKVEILSSYVDPTSGQRKTVDAYYIVRQTFLRVTIRVLTAETSSKTLAAQLTKSDDGEWSLLGSYLDTPSVAVRERSAMHCGAFHLVLAGDPVSSFRGHYWTDRGTQGDVRSVKVIRGATHGSFGEASAAHASA